MNNTKLMINLESITFTVTSSLSLLATINIPQGQTVFFSLVAIGPKGTREIPGITYPLKNEDINLQKLQCVAGGISPEETNFCAVFRTADHATVAYQLPDSSRLYSPLPLIAQLLRDLPDDMMRGPARTTGITRAGESPRARSPHADDGSCRENDRNRRQLR